MVGQDHVGALVTVVAPEASEKMRLVAEQGLVAWRARGFEPGDVEGARLVIAATPSREVNEQVAAAAREAGTWVNVADDPELSTFYLPSVLDRSPLKVAVSTSGASPAYAREIRKRFERLFDPEAGEFVQLLGSMREKARRVDPERVGEIGQALVESGAEEAWLEGDRERAREMLEEIVEKG
jgi:siroheme synthase-like protein